MTRGARIFFLVVSRVFIVLFVGLLYLTSRNEMQWRAADHDPLRRVGFSLAPADPGLRELLGENLEALSRAGYPASAEVLGLIALLRRNQLDAAGERCKVLGWARCSSADIKEMHEAVRWP
jgi:hypothetical protein